MPNAFGWQTSKSFHTELWHLMGMILTDGSGVPTNTNANTVLDQDGEPLRIPLGFSAVAKTGTGLYTLTLSDPWPKLVSFENTVILPGGAADGVLKVVTQNPRGTTVNSIAPQTINLVYVVGGAAANLVSGGFFFLAQLRAQ